MGLTGDSHPVYGTDGQAEVITGTAVDVSQSTVPVGEGNVSYQVVVTETTATVAGTLLVQVSNSPRKVPDSAATWDTYSVVSVPAISGAMTFTLKLTRMAVGRIRLHYTNATGAGTIQAYVVRG